jgi:hypothetical protein
LEIETYSNSILRRYYLIDLVHRRNERERYHLDHRPVRPTRNKKASALGSDTERSSGRAASKALDDLMSEAYPLVKVGDDYSKIRIAVQNRLNCGRNWYVMQQRPSSGGPYLLATGEDYKIQNYL